MASSSSESGGNRKRKHSAAAAAAVDDRQKTVYKTSVRPPSSGWLERCFISGRLDSTLHFPNPLPILHMFAIILLVVMMVGKV